MSDEERMQDTHDCGGDAAAYVLGAMEADEAQEFELHLRDCAVCRDEVAALGGAVLALPLAAPQVSPPADIRRRVMRQVRADVRRERSATGWRAALLGSPNRAIVRLASVAAVAALIVKFAVLSGGDTITLIHATVTGVRGSAELRVQDDRASLRVSNFTPAGKNKVYEVWLLRGNTAPVRAGVLFEVGGGGRAEVRLPQSMKGVKAVLVTPEPHGGTPSPTHSPVIIATLD